MVPKMNFFRIQFKQCTNSWEIGEEGRVKPSQLGQLFFMYLQLFSSSIWSTSQGNRLGLDVETALWKPIIQNDIKYHSKYPAAENNPMKQGQEKQSSCVFPHSHPTGSSIQIQKGVF